MVAASVEHGSHVSRCGLSSASHRPVDVRPAVFVPLDYAPLM